jgi:uncharacterized protein (TIGR04255 family)
MAGQSRIISLERPPVVEVALAIQFAPNTFDHLEIARFTELAAGAGFANVQPQPQLARVFETFSPEPIRIDIQMNPAPRYWLIEASGERLLQIQHDRFGVNWRRMPGGGEYPRYAKLRDLWSEQLAALETLHGSRLDGDLCEVTYVNHMETDGRDVAQITSLFSARRRRQFLPPMERGQVAASWIIPDTIGDPTGRLHLTVGSAVRAQDLVPITVLTLIARGKSLGPGLDGILGFADIGREWVVRAFRELTTPALHRVWGLREEKEA